MSDSIYWPINSTNTSAGQYIVFNASGESTTPVGNKAVIKKKQGMPIQIFFSLMKKKMGLLAGMRLTSRLSKYEKMLEKADKAGQIALSEELMKRIFVTMRETEMYAAGFRIFLTRDVYERFCYKTERKVALTKLANYARVIPDDVLDKKAVADKAKLFDQYFVMHYDGAEAVKETVKEKVARAKDPILFGSIEGSEKLYYVADWEDEFCDLTLDDIVDKLKLDEDEITISKNPELLTNN